LGRALKRVPLDFEWPLNQTWIGYINPHYAKSHNCSACKGDGSTFAAQRLGDLVSLLMLSGSDSLQGKCHPYLSEAPLYRTQGMVCGLDMAELTGALAGRPTGSPWGHDAIDKWTATKKIITAAGLPEKWGLCPACDGNGTIWESSEDEKLADEWIRSEPPTGDGYQVWETVSEGSPISPVFATPEDLAAHMATTRWGADKGTSYEQWMKFITGPGWVPSGIMDANGYRNGVDAIA